MKHVARTRSYDYVGTMILSALLGTLAVLGSCLLSGCIEPSLECSRDEAGRVQ